VRYGRLADIGRELVEREVARPAPQRLLRYLLRKLVAYPRRVAPLLLVAQALRPLLPAALRRKVPARQPRTPWPRQARSRRMLVLAGCVQSVATPHTNAAAARVLNRLGIQLIEAPGAGCCGAVSHHLSAHQEGLDFMRRNIDAWWPFIEQGIEAILVTASGCGALVKDYGLLLAEDPAYADKARRVSALARDISEVLRDADLSGVGLRRQPQKVAFHSPCTLQHGQQLDGVVEGILSRAGFTLTAVADAHLCCGSAGTYSILQPALSQQLLTNKLAALEQDGPDVIATANIGCQMHLASSAGRPVRHWIELLDEAMR
jgi:glycolate oxidase iron-sulfur subunit